MRKLIGKSSKLVGILLILAMTMSLVAVAPVAATETPGTISLDSNWYKISDTVMVTVEDADLDVLQSAPQDESSTTPDDSETVFQFNHSAIEFAVVNKPYDMRGDEYLVQSVNDALGQITLQAAPPAEAELMALTAYASLPGTIVQPTKATLLTVFLNASPASSTSVTITVSGTTTEGGTGDSEEVNIDDTGASTPTIKHFSLITDVKKTSESGTHGTTEAGIKCGNLIFADYTYYGVETFEGSVISSVDADGVTPPMTETGPHTGIFEGTLTLAETTSDTADSPALMVIDGGTITAVYDDADPVATVTASATIDDTAPTLIGKSPADGATINDTTPLISVDVLDFESGFAEPAVLGMGISGLSGISPLQTEIPNGYHLEYQLGTGEALLDGAITVTITGEDIVGNLISPNTWTFDVDLTAPTMDSADTATTTTIAVTFSEELDDATVAASDFLAGGLVTPTEVSVATNVVTLTVPEMPTDATPTVALVGAVSDIAGNELTEPDDVTATDGVGPTVAIAVSPDPAGAAEATFTLTFNETMKTSVDPTVTFTDTDSATPPGGNTVSGDWTTTTTWQGTFDISTLATAQEYESEVTVTSGQDLAENVMEEATGSFDIDTLVAAPTFWPVESATVYTDSPVVRVTFTEEVTITAATFDDEDVLADLTTTDGKTYRLATEGLEECEHTIMVSAEDSLGNIITDASATFTVSVSQNITLYEGWNLISLPLIPDDSDIATVMSSVSDNVTVVHYYDAANSEWLSWSPDGTFTSLATMEDGKGYWVSMTAEDTLTVTGREMPVPPVVPPTYDVVVGWNLIGLKSVSPMNATDYLLSIEGTYPVLWSYDAEAGLYSNVKDGTMEVSHGFWLWALEAGTIVPPGPEPV
ncbi:MAG: hypothetical protein J7K94_03110 [Dehalococcoidia bacterium]|nr:hypothetical protein [Dehalococcoidia bacterium]